jgi:hypothetical protein
LFTDYITARRYFSGAPNEFLFIQIIISVKEKMALLAARDGSAHNNGNVSHSKNNGGCAASHGAILGNFYLNAFIARVRITKTTKIAGFNINMTSVVSLPF